MFSPFVIQTLLVPLFISSSFKFAESFQSQLKVTECLRQQRTISKCHQSVISESIGVTCLIDYVNSKEGGALLNSFCQLDPTLKAESDRVNFWTGGNFVVLGAKCLGIVSDGLNLCVDVNVKGKLEQRFIQVPFPFPVIDESCLKNAIIDMANTCGRIADTGTIAKLSFGTDHNLPLDFRFNDVPHAAWVRSYIYDAAAKALDIALNCPASVTPNKSRLQMKINIPEMNPAFDTYRIGTLLEMVRAMVLPRVYDGGRVRVCVQQSLGEGVLSGMPLALASMKPVLERMDWCGFGPPRAKKGEVPPPPLPVGHPDETAVRFGQVGADQLAESDSLVVIIAPQNVVGGSLMASLEEMVAAAERMKVPMVLVNPLLEDRPSSNNVMQVRGRAERRALQDSFQEIFCFRLLYPSTGGYMFPIRGLLVHRDPTCPYVAYAQDRTNLQHEAYLPVAAFPPRARAPPDISSISKLFTG